MPAEIFGHRWWREAGAVLASAALAATLLLPVPARAQQEELVTEGARVYGATCGRCHNPRSPLERTDRDWVTIANHMRVRANLTGPQLRAVLAFLQASNTNPRERMPLPATGGEAARPPQEAPAAGPVSTDPEVVARGRELVQARACVGCHVIGGQGGQVGPTLDGVVGRKGPEYVRRKLADPTFDNPTSMMPNFGLAKEEIEAILAYLATLNGKE